MRAAGCIHAGLGDDVWVCSDGGLEIGVECGAGAGAHGGGGVERFSAAENIAVSAVDVAGTFGTTEVGTGFEHEPGHFGHREEGTEVGFRGCGGHSIVEIDGNGGVENS